MLKSSYEVDDLWSYKAIGDRDNILMMTGEERFVKGTARVVMRDADVRNVRDAVLTGIDWDVVLSMGRVHDVEGSV